MLILADLGHDPKHWPLEAATAADNAFLVSGHWWLGTKLMRICQIHATHPAYLCCPNSSPQLLLWYKCAVDLSEIPEQAVHYKQCKDVPYFSLSPVYALSQMRRRGTIHDHHACQVHEVDISYCQSYP